MVCHKKCIVIFIAFILSGCAGDKGSALMEDYLQRLENVLGIESASSYRPDSPKLSHYPWGFSDKLKSDSDTGGKISILQFLSLYGCDLQMVVAEGNNSLGKFAPSSQVLLRHLRFLHHTPACLDQLDESVDAELIAQLKTEQNKKQAELPGLIWQALLNEEEAKSFWSIPNALGDYPGNVSIDPELAVARLAYLSQQWIGGNYLEGLNELERLLGDLRSGDGGALISAYQGLIGDLEKANRLLKRYIESESCVRGRPSIDLNVLNNVVQKVFVGNVQVWAAELNRRVYGLIEQYRKLESIFLAQESEGYKRWRIERDALLDRGVKATAQHVQVIQLATAQCDSQS